MPAYTKALEENGGGMPEDCALCCRSMLPYITNSAFSLSFRLVLSLSAAAPSLTRTHAHTLSLSLSFCLSFRCRSLSHWKSHPLSLSPSQHLYLSSSLLRLSFEMLGVSSFNVGCEQLLLKQFTLRLSFCITGAMR